MNEKGWQDRELVLGLSGAAVVAMIMLAWAVWGDPPYAFFGIMKWVVSAVMGLGGYVAVKRSGKFLPLAVVLWGSAAVEFFGKMRREEWVVFNIISMVALGGLAVTLCVGGRK